MDHWHAEIHTCEMEGNHSVRQMTLALDEGGGGMMQNRRQTDLFGVFVLCVIAIGIVGISSSSGAVAMATLGGGCVKGNCMRFLLNGAAM